MRRAALLPALALALGATGARAADAPAGSPTSLVGTVITVADPERELAFYRDAFGLTLGMTLDHGSRREYMLRFGDDARAAGLILLHDSAPGAAPGPHHGTQPVSGFDRLVLRVADLDALVARLDRLGRPHDPVRDAGHGYRVLTLADPEGTRLEVIQPAASPSPTGAVPK